MTNPKDIEAFMVAQGFEQEDGFYWKDGTFHLAYVEPYDKEFRGSHITDADTLTDALAKLCIELFKQNILTKGHGNLPTSLTGGEGIGI